MPQGKAFPLSGAFFCPFPCYSCSMAFTLVSLNLMTLSFSTPLVRHTSWPACKSSAVPPLKAVTAGTQQEAPSDSSGHLPDGEMCLQEMEGSGFPVARHTRVTLLPSFTTMSLEIRNIFGETERKRGEVVRECHRVSATETVLPSEQRLSRLCLCIAMATEPHKPAGRSQCRKKQQQHCEGVTTAISITSAAQPGDLKYCK